MKQKKIYEAPCTSCTCLEFEGFVAASIFEDSARKVETMGHEVGSQYTFDDDGFITDENGSIGGGISWE